MRRVLINIFIPLISTSIRPSIVWAGQTACASNQMEWYTSVVGETPCGTYEKLRKICNPDYQVQTFRDPNNATTGLPGDFCDDEIYDCCCNTVAFQLSMLCTNCQYDTDNGSIVGFDAPPGTYNKYRHGCVETASNHTLPPSVQDAVCNLGIRLDDLLYSPAWSDGSCAWTKDHSSLQHVAKNNNTFMHCPGPDQSGNSPTPSSIAPSSSPGNQLAGSTTVRTVYTIITTSTPSYSQDSRAATHTPAIVGSVVGGLGAVTLAFAGFVLWRIRSGRRRHHLTNGVHGRAKMSMAFRDFPARVATSSLPLPTTQTEPTSMTRPVGTASTHGVASPIFCTSSTDFDSSAATIVTQ
ncbi:hypothetical protein C8Q80DRAFT_1326431 [Daedaleopsis nitida]|nr:hypothetical protein C8Q80DRAFT_1326431 [Daedaleopsis nitida]